MIAPLINRLIELDQKAPKHILILGDAMTDVYIHGTLVKQCQEGCDKFTELYRVTVPGGAANAAMSISHWTSTTTYIEHPASPVKTRFMFRDSCAFRYDKETIVSQAIDYAMIRSRLLEALNAGPPAWRVDGVLFSDYDKGMLTEEFIQEVVRICMERRIPCVADVKRKRETYTGCILKGNVEYQEKFGKVDVLTRGFAPPKVFDRHVLECNPSGQPYVSCVNHVGAGDCFAAHLVLGLVHGFSLVESARIAYIAGRVYVQHEHNTPPLIDDIRNEAVLVDEKSEFSLSD